MMLSTLRRAWPGPLLLLLALGGCGGGGDAPAGGTGLTVTPSALSFSATSGEGLPAPQTISATITSNDAARIIAGYPAGTTIPTWLSLSIQSAGNPAVIGVAVNTTTLPGGVYTTTVRVAIGRSDDTLIAYRDVPVTYTIAAGRLSAAPVLLSFTQIVGGATPPPQGVSLEAGVDSYPWTATLEYADGNGWLQVQGAATASGASLPAMLDVSLGPTAGMVAGTYAARIHVSASTGTLDVPVTLLVRPARLTLSATTAAFDVVAGQSALPAGASLALGTEAGTIAYTPGVAYGPGAIGWLDVTGSGAAPETIAVAPNTTQLPPGTLTATVTLTPSNGAEPVVVDVTYRLAIPQLDVSPATATFSAVAGQTALPAAVPADVGAQAGTIAYVKSIAYGPSATGWLDVSGSGTAPETIAIQPSTTLLPAGTHTATVTLGPLNGATPVDVQVSYTVTASQLGLSPGSLAFSVDPASQPSALAQALAVTDSGAQLAWTAVSSAPWVSVSPSSGNTDTTASVALSASALEALANGTYTATLTFTSNGPSVADVTKTLTVTLSLGLPLVHEVAPYVAYLGQGKQVVLRGQGFTALVGPTVDFGGSAGSAVTVVSDTELRAVPPALGAGRYPVRVANGNQLGLARTTAELAVVPVRTHTAGLISNPGPRQRLAYDAERACLYGAHAAAGVVQRWCDSGNAWAGSDLSLAGVRDIALAPDGKALLAITGTSLYRIDADSFTVIGSATASQLGISLSGIDALKSVVMTNDGKALLLAGYSWLSLYRLDPSLTEQATAVLPFAVYNGTLSTIMAASLDGDRVVTGDSGISSPTALSYDATDGTWTRPPAFAVYSVTLDRSGTRIGAAGSVYDGSFADMGYAGNWRMTVSPSGARAYAYYPSTPAQLLVYDISGTAVTQVGPGTAFPIDPGSTGNASNLLLTSLDGGTLFVDGTSGILVMPAP